VPTIAQAVAALVVASNALAARQPKATGQELQDIINEIRRINAQLAFLDQLDLQQAAIAVSEAANALQAIVATARLGPFDATIDKVVAAAKQLSDLQGQIRGVDALPKATAPASPTAAAAPPSAAGASPPAATAPPPGQPSGIPVPVNSTDFATLRREYETFYEACAPKATFSSQIAFYVTRLTKNKDRYEAVGDPLGIPWKFVGIIHGLECSFNFGTHLHNGDPLGAKTINVPAGRPPGNPPFKWEDSARDALTFEGFGGQADWSVPQMLFRWEKYNGFGYRPHGIPSPYLWSFSNIYDIGKFSSDGHFDPTLRSRQCGAAVMLKALG
jgi:lysozyme family protein